MRLRVVLPLCAAFGLALPASVYALPIHQVGAGESLYSIAAQDGLSVSQLAAANGISAGSWLTSGSAVVIPPQSEAPAYSAPVASSSTSYGSAGDDDADSDDVGSGSTAAASTVSAVSSFAVSSAPSSAGGLVVEPGDTLSGLSRRTGIPMSELAAANGLSSYNLIMAGTVMRLPGSRSTYVSHGYSEPVSTATSSSYEPQGAAAQGTSGGPPYPTPERLSGSEIGSIGAGNGATSSLADAIAWQESGFNNDLVSSADARGIMQILPGTWEWIQHSLDTGTPLAPASATDNVRGGSLMLHWLLNQTGGDPAMAAAGYYQGLASVRQHGMLPDTQRYVNDVMSLRSHFGGG